MTWVLRLLRLRFALRLRLLLTRTECRHWNEGIQATRWTLRLLLGRSTVVRGRRWMIRLFDVTLIAPFRMLSSIVFNRSRLDVMVMRFMIDSIVWSRGTGEVIVLDISV